MSSYRFGAEDYGLNYYPPEAGDCWDGVDWEKVERVEIEGEVFVRERTAWKVKAEEPTPDGGGYECLVCSECDECIAPEDCDDPDDGPAWCERCGARILGTLRCPKCGEVMWSEGGGGYAACVCGARVRGYGRTCQECGAVMDYENREDAPKAVLD